LYTYKDTYGQVFGRTNLNLELTWIWPVLLCIKCPIV